MASMQEFHYKEHIANLIGIVAIIAVIWVGVLGLKLLHDSSKNTDTTQIITCQDLTDAGKDLILKDTTKCKE